jgi:hypothetical protein
LAPSASHIQLVRSEPSPAPRPAVSAEAIARWRRAADALLWLLVDELESAELAVPQDGPFAALELSASRSRALASFQRAVARRLRGLVPPHEAPAATQERADQDVIWQLRAEQALEAMDRDPNAVERFARLWVGVLQDAALHGRAGLFVR